MRRNTPRCTQKLRKREKTENSLSIFFFQVEGSQLVQGSDFLIEKEYFEISFNKDLGPLSNQLKLEHTKNSKKTPRTSENNSTSRTAQHGRSKNESFE